MTTTLFLGQNVDLRQEARVRRDRAGLGQHHPALHFLLPDSSKKKADVVPRSSLVQELPEHLDSRDHRLLVGVEADKRDFLSDLDDAALDPARRNRTATRN